MGLVSKFFDRKGPEITERIWSTTALKVDDLATQVADSHQRGVYPVTVVHFKATQNLVADPFEEREISFHLVSSSSRKRFVGQRGHCCYSPMPFHPLYNKRESPSPRTPICLPFPFTWRNTIRCPTAISMFSIWTRRGGCRRSSPATQRWTSRGCIGSASNECATS